METKVNIKQFYKELGKLLYAVAKVDSTVQKKEIKALNNFVSKELAFFEDTSDASGMNQAFYTYFEFDECMNNKMSVEDAHTSFIKFLDANIMDLDPDLIKKTIMAIEKVASSYRKINRDERVLINKIKTEIKDIADLF